MRDGADVTVIATGHMVCEALLAAGNDAEKKYFGAGNKYAHH